MINALALACPLLLSTRHTASTSIYRTCLLSQPANSLITGPPSSSALDSRSRQQGLAQEPEWPHKNRVLEPTRSLILRKHGPSVSGSFGDGLANERALHRHVTKRLSGIIKHKFGGQYDVAPFGSTVYMRGFGVNPSVKTGEVLGGDLDLVVLDFNRPQGFSPEVTLAKLPDIYNMRKLAHVLSRNNYSDVMAIPQANVPIVKFYDAKHGLHMDINVNDRLGIINSYMLRAYCDLLPGLRSVIAAIKLWARPLGFNSPGREHKRSPTLSTYALALMTLGWLQSRGLAPNLQDGLEVLTQQPVGTSWIRPSPGSKKTKRVACDVRFRTATAEEVRPPLDLRATMLDWFHFWGHEYEFKDAMVDIKEGGIHPRPSIVEPPPADNQLPIEDVPSFDGVDSNFFGLKRAVVTGIPANELERPPEQGDDPSSSDSAKTERDGLDEYPPDDIPNPTTFKGPICVVDPFIRSKNVTKNISGEMVKQFRAACQTAWDQANKDVPLDSIIRGFDAFKDVREPLVHLPEGPAGLFNTSMARSY
ncbi:hypothetical protein PAXRUDRAFT_829328 [Paxillus rubicundulus Ve08.2h10]|uniref:Poly(A) RNA polymerase mitochondrial-like central palm domain-containing protein n=1 Tax=Paxillus rubicundulus Ve08.2h10 TaxID=930991 RepID=A0A0D0DMZ6_9AGAM|nr:hypothetical protein PAXRUDRAFT_829328 [Paxillus rubicundulus Ve08.2h10]